ncbi:uncharacterized protein F5147DRAFT_748738 [Suillus discolor]|uniref:DUF6570 domain-containing protein n=1 Tax=Suillus discolor TaxID=1912936 RepID=A0A9P7ERR5_9AGAM|nr:uncharacterized protein F5147DRAFT_748738 [Suillus discolor]KAG2085190.1 hypothetical protein F5147DRAFT_748738 [Suillus discolor]
MEFAASFCIASTFDLMLVSHARASQITHFYAYKPSRAHNHVVKETSQRYNKGNVAVRPQDSTELRNFLPPSHDELRDAMCVVFTGQTHRPSPETVKQMQPILVTKSRVHLLIEFLIANNPWYQKSGVAYSQNNMDALFEDTDANLDCSMPAALEICHLPREGKVNANVTHEGPQARDSDLSDDTPVGDIVMEAVEKMKLQALAYVLDRKQFLLSHTGEKFVADNDPGTHHLNCCTFTGLLSYLFPHLDPWDIGGFYHCGRTPKQYLSMEAQVRNLLHANFAFILSMNTNFRVCASQQQSLANELKALGPSLTSLAEKWTRSVNEKPSTMQEKKAACLLHRLQSSTKALRGSVGYKLCH